LDHAFEIPKDILRADAQRPHALALQPFVARRIPSHSEIVTSVIDFHT